MNELYQNNLTTLERRYPELVAALNTVAPDPQLQLTKMDSGEFLNLIRREADTETPFYPDGDPVESARGFWQRKELRNPAILLFLGLDLGYHLSVHLTQPNPNTQAYLLVERDLGVFRNLLQVLDITPLVNDPRFHFVVGVDEESLFPALRNVLDSGLLYTYIRATAIIHESTSYRLHTAYYKRCMEALGQAAKHLFDFVGNAPHDTVIGVRHMLLNLDTIAHEPGLIDLHDRFHDRPGVVVATGPSLDKNFRLLEEIQDRAVITCVDASFKFLLGNGIRPHLVTCLERGTANTTFFDDIDPETCSDSVQVATPVVVPEVYSAYTGPKAIMYRKLINFDWLQHDKGTIPTGHSSANMAFKILEYLGCNPIILIGQDLSYGDDGASHAEAGTWGKHNRDTTSDSFRLRGNVQEWVWANNVWNVFRVCYVRDVAGYRGTVINATEGGAYIEGTQVQTLRQAIDQHVGEAFAPAEQIRDLLRRPSEEQAREFLQQIREQRIPETIAALDDAMVRFRRLARRARRTLEREARLEQLENCLSDTFTEYNNAFESTGMLYQAAFQVVQPSFMHARAEYFDIPNRYSHIEQIHRVRLECLEKSLRTSVAILERVKALYLDPVNTLPLPEGTI